MCKNLIYICTKLHISKMEFIFIIFQPGVKVYNGIKAIKEKRTGVFNIMSDVIKKRKIKVLITGAGGMLGSDVVKIAALSDDIEAAGTGLKDFDICDTGRAEEFIANFEPDAIIHCAAFTSVDAAESEAEKTFRINAMAVRDLAVVCARRSIKFVLISTDYVFDGLKNGAYAEYDRPAPLNVYGMSKYYAEQYCLQVCPRCFIVRTSWLFGFNGANFVKTILKKAEMKEISVVDDQYGSPTFTRDLAKFLIEIVKTEKYGIYHATNEGYCSWHGFAQKILSLAGLNNIKLYAVKSDDFKRAALRPKNSMLLKTALYYSGFNKFRSWQDALAEYIMETGLVSGH